MATATAQLGTVGSLLQTGGDDIATRVNVFEEIYLVFLVLGTLVGIVVITYTLHKAYKYRAGSGREDDKIGRPQLGELPTGADKGGRKLFLSFTLSAIIVVSLIAWTYGLLLFVETGAAESPEDAVEAKVVGANFAWEFHYQDEDRLPRNTVDSLVQEHGQDAVLEALRTAQESDRSTEAVLEEELGVEEVETNLTTSGTFHVPTEREVHITVTSGDVWHNFGIPELRVKSDAIPGETTETWFVAEEAGEYRAECFELCGSGHSNMVATVNARDDFDQWYQEQTIATDELIQQLESGEYQAGGEESGGGDGGNETDGGQESVPRVIDA